MAFCSKTDIPWRYLFLLDCFHFFFFDGWVLLIFGALCVLVFAQRTVRRASR